MQPASYEERMTPSPLLKAVDF